MTAIPAGTTLPSRERPAAAWHVLCFRYSFARTSSEQYGRARPGGSVMNGRAETAGGTAAQFRVLVVDDYPDAADSLALYLRVSGFDVRAAYRGRQALALLEVYRPHCVVTDIVLPDMSGRRLAYQARRLREARPVLIALTGYSDERDAPNREFDYCFAKPADPRILAGLLRQLQSTARFAAAPRWRPAGRS